jgi:hypothetical protein
MRPVTRYTAKGTGLTVRELIDEQRRLLGSSNPAERLAAALLIPAALAKQLNRLADHQIGQLLDDEVGARLNLLAPEATICLVAADRLRRRVNGTPERKPFGIRRRARRSWAAERDEGTHVLSAEVSLYRAGVPFLQLPWPDESVRQRQVHGVEHPRSTILPAASRVSEHSPLPHCVP